MYSLSKDYSYLYKLICEGDVAVGFVDYVIGKTDTCRDVCMIRRHKAYDIFIGVRGVSYANVYSYMEKHGSELDVFEGLCQAVNLEWIEPQRVIVDDYDEPPFDPKNPRSDATIRWLKWYRTKHRASLAAALEAYEQKKAEQLAM